MEITREQADSAVVAEATLDGAEVTELTAEETEGLTIVPEEEEPVLDAATRAELARLTDEISKAVLDRSADMSEDRKDQIFVLVKRVLLKNYFATLRNAKFDLNLTKDQYEYLIHVLETQLSYGVDEVFQATALYAELYNTRPVFKTRKTVSPLKITASTMTLIYHLIAKHKVKGLGATASHFCAILTSIGRIAKQYNPLEEQGKRLESETDAWVVAVTPVNDGEETPGVHAAVTEKANSTTVE